MEAIGTLAGGIAHDVNNMLGIITGNISYALSNLNKHDEIYEVFTDLQESSKQAQGLTHQLLTFSKTELLNIDSDVKAIVSSGYSNNPIMSNYKDYSFCGIVPKPYTKAQLADVLNKVFA